MKKRIIMLFALMALSMCIFALCVSASDVYSDYTQEGANGAKPIFTFSGYAIDPENKCICVEYTIDFDALDAYKKASGEWLQYGVVVAYNGFVENACPLDPATAKPVGANKDKIIVYNATDNTNPVLSVRVVGLDPTQYKKELAICLFTFDKNGVKYISDSISTDTVDPVSYSEIRGPLEVTVNGMTYSTDKETKPAGDRVKQMNASSAAYKSTPNLNVSSAKRKANTVVIGGTLAGYTQAKTFLKYYLSGEGGTYNLDVANFLSTDSGALKSRNAAFNNALRAAELLALEGEIIDIINQTEENHPMQGELANKDWQYTVGSYFTDVDIIDLTVTEENGVKTYTASLKYIVVDFYNWEQNDYNPFLGLPSILSPSPHELYTLHTQGSAQEFLTYGEITYSNITWTEGQTVDQISALN